MKCPQLNQVVVAGNLTDDPRTNILQNGIHVANFRIAANKSYKDRNGDWQEKTAYIDVVCWKGVAERTAARAFKGSAVIITGELQFTQWEKDGQKRSRLEVLAQKVTVLDAKHSDPPEEIPEWDGDPGDIPF